MHVSTNDIPSDKFGAVSDVSRPLLYKLNQASMSRTTHEALSKLLSWALDHLENGIANSLHNHEVHHNLGSHAVSEPVVPENQLPETPQEPLSAPDEGGSVTSEVKSLVAPATVRKEDSEPLPAITAQEEAEEAAEEALIAAEVAKQAAVVVEPVEAEVVPAETVDAPVELASPKATTSKRIVKPV